MVNRLMAQLVSSAYDRWSPPPLETILTHGWLQPSSPAKRHSSRSSSRLQHTRQKSWANEQVMNEREGSTRRGPHVVLAMWAGWPTVDVP